MTKIEKYELNNGQTRYKYRKYLGVDPLTGKKMNTTRSGFKSLKEAKMDLLRLELAIESGEYEKKKKEVNFEEVYELWFKTYKDEVKESTWSTTRRNFRIHILPLFGNTLVDKITSKQCQEAINYWFEQGLVKYNVFLNFVSKVLEYAYSLDMIKNNPAKHVVIPRRKISNERKNIENFYEKEELIHFFECLQDDGSYTNALPYFRLLAFSGMRKSEALCLKWNDIDLDNGTVSISKTATLGAGNRLIVQIPKTSMSDRIAYIDSQTCLTLRHWKLNQKVLPLQLGNSYHGEDNLVFSNIKNEMFLPIKPQIWLKHIETKYKLKHVTVHSFRHTYATLALEAGATIKSVQEQLGHSTPDMTMRKYVAVTKKQRNEATTKLSQYLGI